MSARSHFTVIVSLGVMLLVGNARAADGAGKVCVARIPTGERWDANGTGAKEASTFTIQLDKLAPVLVTTNTSGVFTNLALAGEHSIRIRLDGKPLASFKFSFDGRGDHLRLWYNPFYGSWSLSDVRSGDRCACPKAKASTQAASGSERWQLSSMPDVSRAPRPAQRCSALAT